MLQYIEYIPPIVRIVVFLACFLVFARIVFKLIRNNIVHNLRLSTEVELLDGNKGIVVDHLPEHILEIKRTDGKRVYVKEWGIRNLAKSK